MKTNPVLVSLGRCPPFSSLPQAVLERLAARCCARRFAAGETVFRAGESADVLWLVISGLIRVCAADHRAPITVAFQGAGELVDNMGLLRHHRHVDEATAIVPVEAIAIPLAAYEAVIDEHPAFGVEVGRLLAARLGECRRLRALLNQPGRQRLAGLLLLLSKSLGEDIPLTRAMLADFAGLSREATIRLLSPLEKNGLIVSKRGHIRIRKPKGIENEALLER